MIQQLQLQFRMYDKKYKKMQYRVSIGNTTGTGEYVAHAAYFKPGDTDYKIEHPGMWMHFDEYSDVEIMQSTGLKDTNKQIVFEGDILQSIVDDKLFNWLVVFKSGSFGIINIGVEGYLGEFYRCDSEYYFYDRKIIGNKFENTELLK